MSANAVAHPELPAYASDDGTLHVWCAHCGCWHHHSTGAGRHRAHCHVADSPYIGFPDYVLAAAGPWTAAVRREHAKKGRTKMRKKPTRLQNVYQHAQPGQKCSVPGCDERAVWCCVLVDYYEGEVGWFFEQDYTCPFICQHHKRANGMDGQRFTNLNEARGHSEYLPISVVAQTAARYARH